VGSSLVVVRVVRVLLALLIASSVCACGPSGEQAVLILSGVGSGQACFLPGSRKADELPRCYELPAGLHLDERDLGGCFTVRWSGREVRSLEPATC
jgi:hypothetical protein